MPLCWLVHLGARFQGSLKTTVLDLRQASCVPKATISNNQDDLGLLLSNNNKTRMNEHVCKNNMLI